MNQLRDTMNHKQQIKKITDYIAENLDDNLSLEHLSEVADFSKYHFHRLFTAYTGLSLKQYIRWLRMKRAAHQLIVEKNKSIIHIALDAGHESHESFSRAFKKACGESPRQFRSEGIWHTWDKTPYLLPKKGEKIMNVTVKEMPERRLAVMEHRGAPKKVAVSANKLIAWANSQSPGLGPKPGETFGFGYDDPETVSEDQFRFDIGLTVPKSVKLSEPVVEKKLPAGRYAVTLHKGSRENISDTVYGLYRDWLPQTNEELGDLPCLFCYYNFDHEVAQTSLLTEVWILLK